MISVVQRHKEVGGLGLPNTIFYYWAANIHKITYWISIPEDQGSLDWVNMESGFSSPADLRSLICAPLPIDLKCAGNPVIKGTLKIWAQCRSHFGMRQAFSCMPLTNNPMFVPSLLDSTFQQWSRKGLDTVSDLFKNNVFMSFAQIVRDLR